MQVAVHWPVKKFMYEIAVLHKNPHDVTLWRILSQLCKFLLNLVGISGPSSQPKFRTVPCLIYAMVLQYLVRT